MTSIDAFAQEGSGIVQAATRREQWFVATRAGIFPMTLDAIQQSFERGLLHTTTKVWTSGMRAWESLGSIAGLIVTSLQEAPAHPASPRSQPVAHRSYPPPLPAPAQRNPSATRLIPPAPVTTLPRPRTEAVASRSAVEHWMAPAVTWVRSRKPWQAVLLSFVAGTLLGLGTYHQLLWGAANQSVAPGGDAANHERSSELAQSSLRAAAPDPAKQAGTPEREATSPATSLSAVPGALQAEGSLAKRDKPVATRSQPKQRRSSGRRQRASAY